MVQYRNLDQMICTAFQMWLQQNTVITASIPPTSIYDYKKRDLNQSEVIAIIIYPLDYDEWDDPLYHIGNLQLDLVYNTSFARDRKVLQVMDTVATITSQIKQTKDADLITYFNNHIGGLLQFGVQNKGSYMGLYNDSLDTESKVQLTFKYKINWLVYQDWLQSYKCDIESPNTAIHNSLNNIEYIQT